MLHDCSELIGTGNLDDNVNYCNLVSGVYSLLRKLDTKRKTSESSSKGSSLIVLKSGNENERNHQ